MLVLRFLATIFLLIATIAFVSDATPLLDGTGPFKNTTLLEHWENFSPETLKPARNAVIRAAAPWVWNAATAPIAVIPAFVFVGLLALACGFAGRRRNSIRIFAN